MRLPHASLLACGLLILTACGGGNDPAQTPPPPDWDGVFVHTEK